MTSLPLDDARAAQILGWMADHMRRFPKEYEKAQIVALNRVGTKLHKDSIKVLADRYAAKRADITRKITVTKASSANPFVMVRGEGRPIHMGLWPGMPKIVRKDNRVYYGWATKILKAGRGHRLVRGKEYSGGGKGFSAISGKNNHFIIMARKTSARYPTTGLYGPSMIGHLTKPENQEPLMTPAREYLEKVLRHEAQFRLKRLGVL